MQVDVTSDVRRVRIRNAAGVGINVASNPRKSIPDSGDLSVFRVNETIFRDIDKIGPGADPWVPGDDSPLVDYGTLPSVNWHLGGSGVAFDKVSDGATLDRFCMGPNTGTGVHVEYRQQWPELAARNLNITHGLIDSRTERIHWNLNPEKYQGSWDNCGGYFDPNDPEKDSLCDLPSPAS